MGMGHFDVSIFLSKRQKIMNIQASTTEALMNVSQSVAYQFFENIGHIALVVIVIISLFYSTKWIIYTFKTKYKI